MYPRFILQRSQFARKCSVSQSTRLCFDISAIHFSRLFAGYRTDIDSVFVAFPMPSYTCIVKLYVP
jgi:hypothetical protein